MARKKHGRRRRRGTGSIITVKRLSGVERLGNPSSLTGILGPLAIGGFGAVLTTLGIRQWVTPTPENATVVNNATWFGLGVGGLLSLMLWNMTGKPAGVLGLGGAALATAAVKVPEMIASSGMMAAMPGGTAGVRGGMGAIVAETVNGARRRLGAIVMQPASAGSYGPGGGETVTLHGLQAGIIPGAFGTPSFTMGRR